MEKDIKEIILSQEEISNIASRLGAQISKDYQGKELVIIGMLKGGIPFMMELIKNITIPCQIDFMQISSYHGTKSSTVLFKKDIETDVSGKHVIVVDDIIDTGKTTREVLKIFEGRYVASLEVACLLDKPSGRVVEYSPKYIGKIVPDAFVVGFGLDYNEYYRNLPFVGVLKEEFYKK